MAHYLRYLSIMLVGTFLMSSCNSRDSEQEKLDPKKISSKDNHYEMTEEDKNIYNKYLNNLTIEERKEREGFYCGKLGDKTIKFSKDYLFTPLGYVDISFLEQNGWKAKMRWCDDPIISFSVVVDWPSLEPGRQKYGFDKLDWATYNDYLVDSNSNEKIDYSNAVIYVYGKLDSFSEDAIRNNPNNLRAYIESLLKKYRVTPDNQAYFMKGLRLEKLEIPLSKNAEDKEKTITIYWHRHQKTQADLVIQCVPVVGKSFSWCTSYFFPENIPNVVASFVVTDKNLNKWPELIKKSQQLFNKFLQHDNATKNTKTGATKNTTTGVTKKATTDVTKKATTDVTKKATTDVTKKATTDAIKKATTDATKNTKTGATKNTTTDATKNATTDATKNATTDATKDATTDATKDATTDATKNATTDATKDATTDATKDATTDAIKKATTDVTKNATTDATKNATTDATKNATTTDATKNITTDATKDATTTDATKNATTDATKDATTTDATKNITTDATKDATTTDATKNITTDATKDTTTDATK